MKIWVKFLIGAALGMVIGFLLPNTETVYSVLQWFEKLAIGIGRYAVIPVLVFSLTIAAYELRMDEQFWSMVLKNIVLIVVVSFFVIFTGIIITSIITPGRIPIETVEQIEAINLNPGANILEIFPSNMFSVLFGSGVYLPGMRICLIPRHGFKLRSQLFKTCHFAYRFAFKNFLSYRFFLFRNPGIHIDSSCRLLGCSF